MKTVYEVISANINEVPAEFYETLYKSSSKKEVAQYLVENCITDDMACVEEYSEYDDGGFAFGSDYDTPSHFYIEAIGLTAAIA